MSLRRDSQAVRGWNVFRGADFERDKRATTKSDRAGRCWMSKSPVQAAKMEIPSILLGRENRG